MSPTTEPSDLPNGRSSPEPEAVSSHSDHHVNLATGADDHESADEESTKPPTFPEQTQISNLADRDLEPQPDKALDSLPNGTGPDHKPGSRDVRPNEGRIESSEVADAKINGVEGAEIEPVDGNSRPELRKGDEGSRTFTMGELLNELKDDGGRGESADLSESRSSSYALENVRQEHRDQNNVAMELINSVTGVDEDGRSRQRILTFAASRYASAIERNPEDYDALYNWALVLQESADNVNPESSSPSKDALLEEACKKYEEATHLCPTLHDAYYNWAIAISDRAKLRGRTNEAEELLKQATRNYERAVQLNWNSPQALNNWGLALQELSAIVPAREKQTIVRTAISKFRAAIQLQFDFHRAIYNLGTVLYGLAEDTLRFGGSSNVKEVSPDGLYSQSAIYIAAAHALKPNYSVYHSALKLVRSMLPLPYLKVGHLTAPPAGDPVAPHSDWKRSQFVLNHEGMQQLIKDEQKQMSQSLSGKPRDLEKMAIQVDVPDIVSVSACADLTLPPGAGLCINTINGSVFLVADSWESLDGWVDALRLVYTIYARGKADVLAGIITS